jgi:hypothetical protein
MPVIPAMPPAAVLYRVPVGPRINAPVKDPIIFGIKPVGKEIATGELMLKIALEIRADIGWPMVVAAPAMVPERAPSKRVVTKSATAPAFIVITDLACPSMGTRSLLGA